MADGWRYRRNAAIRELDDIRRRFEDEVARPVIRSIWERLPDEMKEWAPSVDVFERGDSFVVKVEIPGVKQEDVDLSVAEDTLLIKGERKAEIGVKEADYHRSELSYGGFYRSVSLPAPVDSQNIDAVYEDGILRITLPIARGAKPKKVAIKVKKAAV